MNNLRNIGFIILFIIVLIFELLLGIITDFSDIKILPFLILLFYISITKFSNSYILPFFFSGIYYDLFYTSNYFGTTSAKFIFISVIVNFIYDKLNNNLFTNFFVFLIATIMYKFELLFLSFSVSQMLLILLISIINYFLLEILNITLKRDVFKKSI